MNEAKKCYERMVAYQREQDAADFHKRMDAEKQFKVARDSLAATIYEKGVTRDRESATKMADAMCSSDPLTKAAALQAAGIADEPPTAAEFARRERKKQQAIEYAMNNGCSFNDALAYIQEDAREAFDN
jgi:hypothetical protein